MRNYASLAESMKHLPAPSHRPSKVQPRDGFQIVLNKCDSGGCDCVALEEEERNKKAAAAAALTSTTARPAPSPQDARFKRTRGNSLASLISRRKPIPNRTKSVQQSPATLQSLQTKSKYEYRNLGLFNNLK